MTCGKLSLDTDSESVREKYKMQSRLKQRLHEMDWRRQHGDTTSKTRKAAFKVQSSADENDVDSRWDSGSTNTHNSNYVVLSWWGD